MEWLLLARSLNYCTLVFYAAFYILKQSTSWFLNLLMQSLFEGLFGIQSKSVTHKSINWTDTVGCGAFKLPSMSNLNYFRKKLFHIFNTVNKSFTLYDDGISLATLFTPLALLLVKLTHSINTKDMFERKIDRNPRNTNSLRSISLLLHLLFIFPRCQEMLSI